MFWKHAITEFKSEEKRNVDIFSIQDNETKLVPSQSNLPLQDEVREMKLAQTKVTTWQRQ